MKFGAPLPHRTQHLVIIWNKSRGFKFNISLTILIHNISIEEKAVFHNVQKTHTVLWDLAEVYVAEVKIDK